MSNKMEFINKDYPRLTRQGMIDLINNHIEVEPILLNQYWLEKLGFEKFNGNKENEYQVCFEHPSSICVTEKHEPLKGYMISSRYWQDLGTDIKYVHQLQNLCFLLVNDLTDLRL